MKVWIDSNVCTQCGLCTDNVPSVFKMGVNSAEVILGDSDIPENLVSDVKQAIDDCPVSCIHEKQS
jgi:ferredoxin